jgi:hypothetical protein
MKPINKRNKAINNIRGPNRVMVLPFSLRFEMPNSIEDTFDYDRLVESNKVYLCV